MTESRDFKDGIRKLVGNDKLKEAVCILEALDSEQKDRLVLLKRRIVSSEKAFQDGIITFEFDHMERSRVAASILEIMNEMANDCLEKIRERSLVSESTELSVIHTS